MGLPIYAHITFYLLKGVSIYCIGAHASYCLHNQPNRKIHFLARRIDGRGRWSSLLVACWGGGWQQLVRDVTDCSCSGTAVATAQGGGRRKSPSSALQPMHNKKQRIKIVSTFVSYTSTAYAHDEFRMSEVDFHLPYKLSLLPTTSLICWTGKRKGIIHAC
jgi:hypothetical protein